MSQRFPCRRSWSVSVRRACPSAVVATSTVARLPCTSMPLISIAGPHALGGGGHCFAHSEPPARAAPRR